MGEIDPAAMARLYADGMSIREIAKAAGLSSGKVYYVLRDFECEFRKRGFSGKHTDDTVSRISASQKGKVLSRETRNRISIACSSHFNGLNGYGHTKKHNRGYILAYAPEHPRAHKDGYVMMHTIIAERASGRYLNDDEVVHHINHRRDDNRPENLVIMTKQQHLELHLNERKSKRGNAI